MATHAYKPSIGEQRQLGQESSLARQPTWRVSFWFTETFCLKAIRWKAIEEDIQHLLAFSCMCMGVQVHTHVHTPHMKIHSWTKINFKTEIFSTFWRTQKVSRQEHKSLRTKGVVLHIPTSAFPILREILARHYKHMKVWLIPGNQKENS